MKYVATYQCRMCMEFLRVTVSDNMIPLESVVQYGNRLKATIASVKTEMSHSCREDTVGLAALVGVQKIMSESEKIAEEQKN